MEERLQNVECQLSLTTPVPKNIYSRLAAIEDKLLYLESVSPEYVQFWVRNCIEPFVLYYLYYNFTVSFRTKHYYRRSQLRKKCFLLKKLMNLLMKPKKG